MRSRTAAAKPAAAEPSATATALAAALGATFTSAAAAASLAAAALVAAVAATAATTRIRVPRPRGAKLQLLEHGPSLLLRRGPPTYSGAQRLRAVRVPAVRPHLQPLRRCRPAAAAFGPILHLVLHPPQRKIGRRTLLHPPDGLLRPHGLLLAV